MTSWKTTRESCAELGALWGTGMSHSWYNPSSSLKLDSLHNCLCCTLQWIVSVSRVMRKTPWLHKAFILLAIYTTAHYVKKQFKHNCIYTQYMFRYHLCLCTQNIVISETKTSTCQWHWMLLYFTILIAQKHLECVSNFIVELLPADPPT